MSQFVLMRIYFNAAKYVAINAVSYYTNIT